MLKFFIKLKENLKFKKKQRKESKKRIKKEIEYLKFKSIWEEKNKHNKIVPQNIFPIEIVKIGKYSYGPIEVFSWDKEKENLEIGNFVSIASGVKFILGGNHEVGTFTTYPFKVMCFNEKVEAWTKGPIVIKDDVWMGMDSLILSGVTIGQGAIIAARSVVTKDVPPYSIVAGNPAKVIKYRYSEEIIKEMIEINWNELKINKLKEIKDDLYKSLDLKLIKKIKNKI
ncbi:MAG: CatB-related O-acetyltransferase [Cetobacterium sp.]